MEEAIVGIGHEALEAVCSTVLFQGFSREEAVVLCSAMQPSFRAIKKGAVFIAEGESSVRIGFLQKGRLSGTRNSSEGQSHILEFYEQGELLGLESVCSTKQTSLLTYTAVEESIVLTLSLDGIMAGSVRPFVANLFLRNMNQMLADRCVRLIYKAEVLSKRALRERIMTFLRIMQRRRGNRFHLGMDREQFAQYLCVNRSALSRELNDMQRDGLICLEEDGSVTVCV
ncbi:MAG: Crp/Fnr family transcriptional regulator [Oscillospiraceae bacterium]|nr:Crp/Fnr family transcriptional regulator [Oscillospiraceae bacterium]